MISGGEIKERAEPAMTSKSGDEIPKPSSQTLPMSHKQAIHDLYSSSRAVASDFHEAKPDKPTTSKDNSLETFKPKFVSRKDRGKATDSDKVTSSEERRTRWGPEEQHDTPQTETGNSNVPPLDSAVAESGIAHQESATPEISPADEAGLSAAETTVEAADEWMPALPPSFDQQQDSVSQSDESGEESQEKTRSKHKKKVRHKPLNAFT